MYTMLVLLLVSSLSVCGTTTFTNPSTGDLHLEEPPSDASGLLCTLFLIMEQVNFNQSLKNIPVPDIKTYREDLLGAIDKVIKNMRWKAHAFFKPFAIKKKK